MAWFIVYGHEIGPYGGHIGNALPGVDRPTDPGYGRPVWDGRPDNSLPWAPVRPGNDLPWAPVRPDAGLPWGPGHPGNALPPGGHPGNWVPGQGLPPLPGNALPGGPPNRPDAGLPGSQPGIDNTLPGGGAVHAGEIWIVAYHPSVGLHWVRVSDITKPGNELPGGPPATNKPVPTPPPTAGTPLPGTPPPVAGTPLPPAAQPKR